MTLNDPATWQSAIDDLLGRSAMAIRSAIVLGQTHSTQDEARRLGVAPGTAVIAMRQLAGRGRLGRRWIDHDGDGVAFTLAIDAADPFRQPRLAVAAAIGVSLALESLLHQPLAIKWPNDVMALRQGSLRKLAGILIEQHERAAFVGIGINVLQTTWPDVLRDRAISMRQLGSHASRLDVLLALLPAIHQALAMPDDELIGQFERRDALRGRGVACQAGTERVAGRVLRIDPLRGLALLTDAGERWLPAATTTVVQW